MNDIFFVVSTSINETRVNIIHDEDEDVFDIVFVESIKAQVRAVHVIRKDYMKPGNYDIQTLHNTMTLDGDNEFEFEFNENGSRIIINVVMNDSRRMIEVRY